jgi:hypothetical protein
MLPWPAFGFLGFPSGEDWLVTEEQVQPPRGRVDVDE